MIEENFEKKNNSSAEVSQDAIDWQIGGGGGGGGDGGGGGGGGGGATQRNPSKTDKEAEWEFKGSNRNSSKNQSAEELAPENGIEKKLELKENSAENLTKISNQKMDEPPQKPSGTIRPIQIERKATLEAFEEWKILSEAKNLFEHETNSSGENLHIPVLNETGNSPVVVEFKIGVAKLLQRAKPTIEKSLLEFLSGPKPIDFVVAQGDNSKSKSNGKPKIKAMEFVPSESESPSNFQKSRESESNSIEFQTSLRSRFRNRKIFLRKKTAKEI